MNRREFHTQAAGLVLAAAASTSQAASNDMHPPIIDPHLHLWDLNRFTLPWLTEKDAFSRTFTIKDYLAATEGLNVVGAVYMEVDVDPKQQVDEANFVLEMSRAGGTPMRGAVISGRPASAEFTQYLDRFKGNQYLKGVRQVLHVPGTPAGYCLSPEFIRGLRALDERGLCFDLCMRPTELGDAVKLAETIPNLRFVLDHCGNGPIVTKDRTGWQRDMDRVARCKNVICKVSGIVVGAPEKWSADDLAPVVNHTLNAFGPDRVMFAGDWPVCTKRATFRQWVEALRTIVRNRPAEEQRKLFHDNAARFYGIRA